MTIPHVAIILVAFRNPDDVAACLASLAASTFRNFSICITENAGADAFAQLIARIATAFGIAGAMADDGVWQASIFADERPILVMSAPDNPGYAGGINRCLDRVPEADAVWILNPDTQADPQALQALVDHAATGPYGIVGGRLVNPQTNQVQLYGGRWRRLRASGYNIGRGAARDAVPDTARIEAEMDYVNGACMLVTRDFIQSVGRMRDDYFLYCEEVDWCLRRGDFRLGYAHDCLILHAHGSTIGSNSNRKHRSRLSVYLDERNRLLLSRRLFPALFLVTAVCTFVFLAQYLRHGAVRNYFTALSGWWAGLRGETGKPGWMGSAP